MNTIKYKIKLKNIFVIALIFMLILPSFTFATNNSQQVGEINKKSINLIEEDLKSKGTSVTEELNKLIRYYNKLLFTEDFSEEQISQIKSLISSLKKQISEYDIVSYNLKINEHNSLENLNKNNIHSASNTYAIPKAAVSAVIAWFNYNGYKLAAELLTHARENKVYNSLYSPINGYRVKQSPVYSKIIKLSSKSGTDSFPNSGTVTQKDLYYAIHEFSWSKHNIRLTIIDKYDFPKGKYAGIEGIAVNAMYEAQRQGIIVPFGIKITI